MGNRRDCRSARTEGPRTKQDLCDIITEFRRKNPRARIPETAFPEPYLLSESENQIIDDIPELLNKHGLTTPITQLAQTVGTDYRDGAADGQGDDALARAGDELAQAAGEIAETVGEGIDAAREAGGERMKIAYDPQICFSGRCGR